ncbi:MAG: hypothetical protein Q9227_005927 [Pyrenula ochraceoflavens]
MSVEISPHELGFRRPFSQEVTETLKLTNNNSNAVAFKILCTTQFWDDPATGQCRFLLQAMKEDPPLDAKCRDKFLVQSVPMNDEPEGNISSVWQNIEKTNKSAIQERKIRVSFLPADSQTPNGVSHPVDEAPPAYSSPSPQFGSPAASTVPIESKPTGAKSIGDAKASASNPASSTISNATTAISNAVPTSSEELKQQLADAKAQIAKLTQQVSDSGVRQRKMQEAGEKMQTVMPQSGDTGVPLQMVAGLCLLSFLLAYFFF